MAITQKISQPAAYNGFYLLISRLLSTRPKKAKRLDIRGLSPYMQRDLGFIDADDRDKSY